MPTVVTMPSVLAGSEEATIARWLVAEGTSVEIGAPLAEIETEKAVVEYASEHAGTVGRLLSAEGDTLAIGEPILMLLADGESPDELEPAVADASQQAMATAPEQVSAPDAAPAATGSEPVASHPAPEAGATAREFASPIARKLAREHGLDVAGIRGTGPNGRIVRRDVEEAAAQSRPEAPAPAAAAPASPTSATPPEPGMPAIAGERIPHSPMRRAIARRLTESKTSVPHFYLTAECRMDALLELRAQVNASQPVKVSVNDFVVKAVAAAFVDVPQANVTWGDDALTRHDAVDVSIAVATENGLVTPVLRDVASTSLTGLAAAVKDLAERAREKRLRQHEIEGGSFSVSNLGMHGVREFSAILNPPQSGILAVGAAQQRPIVVNGELAVGSVMTVTLSADHRALDGELAAQWLAAFQRRIEAPLSILV